MRNLIKSLNMMISSCFVLSEINYTEKDKIVCSLSYEYSRVEKNE
jgi:hypothetical protein